MFRKRMSAAVVVCALAVLAGPASGYWSVTKWAGDGQAWTSIETEQRIEISGPGTYKFYVTEDGEPGDLLGLSVLPGSGAVTVELVTPQGGAGVRDLGGTAFGAGSTLSLATCRVAGNAGTVDTITASAIAGALEVGGAFQRAIVVAELSGFVRCQTLASLTATELVPYGSRGGIEILGNFDGTINVVGPLANLTVHGSTSGSVTVWSSVDDLTIGVPEQRDPLAHSGSILIGDYANRVKIVGRLSGDLAIGLGTAEAFVDRLYWIGDDYPGSGIAGSISVFGDVDDLATAGPLFPSGVVWVSGDVNSCGHSGTLDGVLHVGRDLGSTWINPGGDLRGMVEIGRDLKGQVLLDYGSLSGTLSIGRHVLGRIGITNAQLPAGPCNLLGTIQVSGDLRGPVWVHGGVRGGLIKIYGDMKPAGPNAPAPYIQIDGAFGAYQSRDSLIEIDGQFLGDGRFITIDFDGYDPFDRWEAGSLVRNGTQTYTGNTPQSLIYEVTPCKGDMDNDGDVDFDDVDPFLAALEPGATYDAMFPGLAGSRAFHGDFTGDGYVTFDDLDPFIARLWAQVCSPQGGYLDGEGGGEGDGLGGDGDGEGDGDGNGDGGFTMNAGGGAAGQAAALAAQLRASVSAERLDTLIGAVTALAANPPEGSVVEWDLVLGELLE